MTTDQKLDRILYILENDESTGRIGLVNDVENVKEYLKNAIDDIRKELKELNDKMLVMETEKKVSKAMWGLGGGAISAIVIKLIDLLF